MLVSLLLYHHSPRLGLILVKILPTIGGQRNLMKQLKVLMWNTRRYWNDICMNQTIFLGVILTNCKFLLPLKKGWISLAQPDQKDVTLIISLSSMTAIKTKVNNQL